jgi:two-component system cell cycle sensor histidine kinase/response regulator CckA
MTEALAPKTRRGGLFGLLRAPEPPAEEPGLRAFAAALREPAAMVSVEGRILEANEAWRAMALPASRLPGGQAFYLAFASARRGQPSQTQLRAGEREVLLEISALDARVFLARAREPRDEAASEARRPEAETSGQSAPGPQALDALAAAAPFGAALLDGPDPFEAKVVQANPALVAMAEGKALIGSSLSELIDPASRAEAAERLDSRGGPVEVKLSGEGKRVAQLYLSRSDGPLIVYLVDVSEQKQLELQLSQASKMQAIGQLAGGVAHDFNNLLQAIQFRLDELLNRHPVGDPSYEGLNEIRQTAVRAADLVKKLLTFSRKQTVQRETLDLGEVIGEFEVLLRRLMREDVQLKTEYGRNLPQVRADKAQLETAVMNLAVNARDAVRSQGGGVVRIRTARVSRAEAMSLGYASAPEGEYGMIEVSDTGPGMKPEVLAKIFEPFFTTKALGEGTGLGLATVYGIVKQADGWIAVDSRPGEGATFRIFLPTYTPPAVSEAPPVQPARAKPKARDLSGAGRILFVEDEDAVRGVAARLLRARGYEVLEAEDGEKALELAEANAGQIDLLISDVIMPGLDGPSLLRKARPYLGSAPVMFISGYAEAEFSDLLEDEPGVTFLSKPIDIKSLAERVKQQLQAA